MRMCHDFERYPVKRFLREAPCKTISIRCPRAEARGLKIASCITVIASVLQCRWRRDEPVGHWHHSKESVNAGLFSLMAKDVCRITD